MSASLSGVRVVVTRAAHQADELVSLLAGAGAVVVRYPVLEIVAPSDGGEAMGRALLRPDDYDWLIFTSTNAVNRLPDKDFNALGVAAIGNRTAAALQARGIDADVVAERADSEGLLAALTAGQSPPQRALLVQAEEGRDVLAPGLRRAGWTVDVVAAYRTVPMQQTEPPPEYDVVTFTSPSTVRHFVAQADERRGPAACLGAPTSDAAHAAGFVVTTANDATMASLVEAVANPV